MPKGITKITNFLASKKIILSQYILNTVTVVLSPTAVSLR